MPIESAQYIDTLQPDWPQGVDPEADGDDHLRLVKQVLQNTFPNINGEITGTPTLLNNITSGMWYGEAEDLPGGYWYHQNPADGSEAFVAAAPASAAQFNAHQDLAVTWAAIMAYIYPVGSVLMNSSGINPVDYLGFGTWTQRSGAIYGTGVNIADQFGALKTISPGQHTSDASWRIQNSQITAAQLGVTLTMDAVADHAHGVPVTHIETSSQTYNSISNGSYDAVGGYPQTQGAGGHTPTGTGSTTIGTGAATEGNQFMNPGWAFTVWERTA
jgi:hypothetical protein